MVASDVPPGREALNHGPGQPLVELVAAQASETGCVRLHNEDSVHYHIPSDARLLARKGSLFVLADGMGGHQAGEIASRRAIELAMQAYYADTGQDVGKSLARAFEAANHAIYGQAHADPALAGMGSTLVGAVVLGERVFVANVGDSRAYLVGPRGIAQITDDHSWVEEQVRAGHLSRDQAQTHPRRNLVTRAIGTRPRVDVDLFQGRIGPGERILLCSDGLSGLVADSEIEAAVRGLEPERAARRLVDMANERGGTDNISVLIVQTKASGASAGTPRARGLRHRWIAGIAAALLLLAILAALLLWQVPGLLHRPAPALPTGVPTESWSQPGAPFLSPLGTPVP